jgi:iron complex outermembrane receptor protein
VVTGSLIPTAEEVTAQNVQQVGTRDIQRSGSTAVLEVLQKTVADINGAGNLGSSNANIASGSTQGGAIISIRGLPTLVLDEGRRIADSAAISTGGFAFSDVSLFPTSLVSRIEVLKDGASALYGSDAVGGVINIFLKHDYKGVEIGYRYGMTVESGSQNTLAWVIAGVGNDKANITVGYQYFQTSGLFERERAYSNPSFGTTTYPGRLNAAGLQYTLNAGLITPFGVAGVAPGNQVFPLAAGAPLTGAVAGAYTAQTPAAIVAGFNLSNAPTSYLEENNQNAIASFTYQLWGKRLELFGELLYAMNHNESFLNGQPVTGGALVLLPGHVSTGPGDPTIYNPWGNVEFAPAGTAVAPGITRVSNGDLRARYIDHPRTFTDDTNFIRLLGGLRSQITNDYNFETAFYYSKYQITFRNGNLVNGNQLNAMLAGTAVDFAGNAIPSLDFFSKEPVGTGPGQVSASQFETIFGTNIRYQESWQKVIDAKFTGFPFKLPAGPFGFAIGGEYRSEGFSVTDSPEIFIGSVPIQNIDTSRSVYSAYLELSIPLVSPQMKIPAIYSMDLSLAGRHDHYEGVSKDANVPKITLRWQPIQDLTIRGYFGNSFVAPNLFQLDGPAASGFSTPYNLAANPSGFRSPTLQSQVLAGSNPNLVPSTAQNWGFGAVYSPKWAPGLTISADYFNVLQKNVISTIGAVNIATSVNNLGAASPYYNLVHTLNFNSGLLPTSGPGSGPFNNGTFAIANELLPFRTAGGAIVPNTGNGTGIENVFITDTGVNLGVVRVTGWDFSIGYTWDLKRFGTLQVGSNAVLYVNNDFKTFPNTEHYTNAKGFANTEGVGTIPQYKVNALLQYNYQHWSLGFNYNYTPQTLNALFFSPTSNNNPVVGAFSQIDGRLSYAFVAPAAQAPPPKTVVDPKGGPVRAPVAPAARWYDGLTLTVGCNNIFNHQPPFASGFNSNTDLSTFDGYGRLVYFQASKKF